MYVNKYKEHEKHKWIKKCEANREKPSFPSTDNTVAGIPTPSYKPAPEL
jgi:hypothetical protein